MSQKRRRYFSLIGNLVITTKGWWVGYRWNVGRQGERMWSRGDWCSVPCYCWLAKFANCSFNKAWCGWCAVLYRVLFCLSSVLLLYVGFNCVLTRVEENLPLYLHSSISSSCYNSSYHVMCVFFQNVSSSCSSCITAAVSWPQVIVSVAGRVALTWGGYRETLQGGVGTRAHTCLNWFMDVHTSEESVQRQLGAREKQTADWADQSQGNSTLALRLQQGHG